LFEHPLPRWRRSTLEFEVSTEFVARLFVVGSKVLFFAVVEGVISVCNISSCSENSTESDSEI
ncbi:hypothetical protein L9F63_020909, partial [Diploptera punctata]